MSSVNKNPTNINDIWAIIKQLPAFRYMKDPVDTVSELYQKYPDGNERGAFAFVGKENTFYSWKFDSKSWEAIEGKEGLSLYFALDDSDLFKNDDIPVWDDKKEKFVIRSGNVWNKSLSGMQLQVTRFLNEVDSLPEKGDPDGIYYIHSESKQNIRGIYLVLSGNPIKLYDSLDYYAITEIDDQVERIEDNIELNSKNIITLKNTLDYYGSVINNLPVMLIPKGKVRTVADLPVKTNSVKTGHSYFVETEKDPDLGLPYIYCAEVESNEVIWSNTYFTAYPSDVISNNELYSSIYEVLPNTIFYNNDLVKSIVSFLYFDEGTELYIYNAYYYNRRLVFAIRDQNQEPIASYNEEIDTLSGMIYLNLQDRTEENKGTVFRVLIDTDKLYKTGTYDLGKAVKLNKLIPVDSIIDSDLNNKLDKSDYFNNIYEPIPSSRFYNNELIISIVPLIDLSNDYSDLYIYNAYYYNQTLLFAIRDRDSNPVASFYETIEELPEGNIYLNLTDRTNKNRGVIFKVLIDTSKLYKTATVNLGTNVKLNRTTFTASGSSSSEQSIIFSGDNKQSYWYNRNDFIITSKFTDKNYDIVQLWRPCMQQNLNTILTFFTVWLKENANKSPLLKPVYTSGMYTTMNIASSDNILATRLRNTETGEIEYTSGWHLTSDGKITARTTQWRAYADGVPIENGDYGYAESIEIIVKTEAYNPFTRDENNNPFEILFEEIINYRITRGNIFVIVSRDFKQNCHIDSYGGVASKALGEEIYFPNGHTEDFISKYDGIGLEPYSINVSKSLYPNFNRFIQRNKTFNWYEAVYLLPDYGIGDHSLLPDSSSIYWTYSTKVYHRIAENIEVVKGTKQRFGALYSWFTPFEDNENYLVYECSMNGFKLLFIDVKNDFVGTIYLPESYHFSEFEIIQNYSNVKLSNYIHSDGIDIKGKGSVVLKLK